MGTELVKQLLYGVAVGAVGASTLPSGECGMLVTMWDLRHGAMERVSWGLVPPWREPPSLRIRVPTAGDPGPHGRPEVERRELSPFPPHHLWLGPGAPALWGPSLPLLLCGHLSFSDAPTPTLY